MAKTTTRIPMPVRMRAKQFAMFDALKGLTEAIAEKERLLYPKKELSAERIEEINAVLAALNPGDEVTVEYYCQYGNCYKQITGSVQKIDSFWEQIELNDVSISFQELYSISLN